ncbi:unnamed protein product [Gadus morhua 'NCC']
MAGPEDAATGLALKYPVVSPQKPRSVGQEDTQIVCEMRRGFQHQLTFKFSSSLVSRDDWWDSASLFN